MNDVLNGKGIPRIDPKTGQQTIFTGAGKIAPKNGQVQKNRQYMKEIMISES